jgi:hypothetical protein
MNKKQEEKKGINLMPEDLRSKESGLLSKAKKSTSFDFDFVTPKDSSVSKKHKTGKPFLQKLKSLFNKPKNFGESNAKIKKEDDNKGERPKVIYNPREKKKPEDNEALHIPDKKLEKSGIDFSVDYTDSVLGDVKDKALEIKKFPKEPIKEDKKKSGPSFWEKLFSKKTKTPKIEKVPAKPILAKSEQSHPAEKPHQTKKQPDLPKDIKEVKKLPELIKNSPVLSKSEVKKDKKKSGPSIWDKFKKLFNRSKKAPKVEKVPAKPILAKSEQSHPAEKPKDLLELDKKHKGSPVPPKPDKVNREARQGESRSERESPGGKGGLGQVKDLAAEEKPKFELKDRADKKDSGFTIPSLKDVPDKKTKHVDDKKSKKSTSKFHQPQSRIRAKFLENGGGVDLIPTAAKTRSWRQVINLLLVACLGSAIIIGVFYGFLFYQARNIESQKDSRADQITSLELRILDYENLNIEITELGNEIVSVHQLLGFHFYWNNFFQLLEKYTVSEVYYRGLTAGNGGALTLKAIGTDYDAVARQIKVLQKEEAAEFVTSVDVSGASYNELEEYVEFDVTVVLNPNLFVYNENYIYEIDPPVDDEEEGEGDEE